MENKWIRAAIPALMIHCSIGTVYCWSIFKQAISDAIGVSTFATGWAFSLAIFFLGVSAAFAGKYIEQDIHVSSFISAICFFLGMFGTGCIIYFCKGIPALIGLYICYGVIMGTGVGIGYVTPVKTLMLWFEDQKGLATGICIAGFGLAKFIGSPLMVILQNKVGIENMFVYLSFFYLVVMLIAHLLLKKPDWWEVHDTFITDFDIRSIIKKPEYIKIWLMFYINIHCGLMIISYEKQLLSTYINRENLLFLIILVPSLSAIFNALGRIGYSTLSDRYNQRCKVYDIIFFSSAEFSFLFLAFEAANNVYNRANDPWIILIFFLFVINAGYGGGFSTLPALLSERFGMDNISQIHGITLTAWSIAGLTGNNLSEIILQKSNNYIAVIAVIFVLYLLALYINCTNRKVQ